jgi:hypothetical protein
MDYLLPIVLLFVAGLAGYGIFLLRQAIVSKMTQEKYDLTVDMIEDIVRYCEQMGLNLNWTGADKKAMAINLIHTAFEKIGLPIDEELIAQLIERAVQVINTGKFDFDEITPAQSYPTFVPANIASPDETGPTGGQVLPPPGVVAYP